MSTNFDYNSNLDRMATSLSTKSEHKDILNDSALYKMLQAVSEEEEYSMSNSEYLTYENNWAKARNKSSLLTESKIHRYKVARKQGASGELKIGTEATYLISPSVDISIPKFSQFSGSDKIFVSNEDYVYLTTDTYINIQVTQGTPKSETFSALGDANEIFTIYNDSIENYIFDVSINGALWTETDDVFDEDEDAFVYEINTLSNFSGVEVKFGDGINGRLLVAGDSVEFKYIETEGSEGNILLADVVTSVDSTIYDTSLDKVDIVCTNDEVLAGGVDEPDIEEIRTESPKAFQTGDRAGGLVDYNYIINAFSYVSKSSSWGAYEYSIDNGLDPWDYIPLQDNLIHVLALNTSGTTLTDLQKTDIIDTINDIKPPEDILSFDDVEIVYIIFTVNANVTDGYVLNTVKASISTALSEAYNIDELDFYQGVSESEYIGLIQEVDGVKNHSTDVSFKKLHSFSEAYITDVNLPTFPINYVNSFIYSKLTSETDDDYVLIGTVLDSGDIVGQNGVTFSNSAINLTNGEGFLNITDGLTEAYGDYDIKIVWSTDEDSIVLTDRSQILDYDSSDITVQFSNS